MSNRLELQNLLYEQDIHIALISETWLKPNIQFSIRGYTIIRNDCGNDHNGVAIFVRNGIYFQKLETFSDNSLQNVAIKIKYKQKDISIVSFYSPGNSVPNFDKSKFNRLLHSIPKPLIIAGDFNAHHTIWGCNRTNSRGRDIMDVMDDNDLMLLNNDQPTTVGTNSWRPNGLDLTIVSSSLFLCCEWQVHQDSLGSYHLPTITKFSMVVSETESSSIPSNIPPHSNLIINLDFDAVVLLVRVYGIYVLTSIVPRLTIRYWLVFFWML